MLRWLDSDGSAAVGEGLSWFFRIIPAFAFGEGMINLGSVELLSSASDSDYEIFDMQLTLGPIIFLAWTAILYTIIVFTI